MLWNSSRINLSVVRFRSKTSCYRFRATPLNCFKKLGGRKKWQFCLLNADLWKFISDRNSGKVLSPPFLGEGFEIEWAFPGEELLATLGTTKKMSRNAVQLFQDAKGLSVRWMEQAIPKSISTDGDHMYSYNDVTIGAKEKSYQNQCRKLRKSIKKNHPT